MCSTGTPAINFIKPYKICGLLALSLCGVLHITERGYVQDLRAGDLRACSQRSNSPKRLKRKIRRRAESPKILNISADVCRDNQWPKA